MSGGALEFNEEAVEAAWMMAKEKETEMASTMEETMRAIAERQRIPVERAEVILSQAKCAEYAFHPETKYLLCFESQLSTQQVQAIRSMFSNLSAKNVFVICGSEEPKVFVLEEAPVRFPEQRLFLKDADDKEGVA